MLDIKTLDKIHPMLHNSYSYKTCLAIDSVTRIRLENDLYKTRIRLDKIQKKTVKKYDLPKRQIKKNVYEF